MSQQTWSQLPQTSETDKALRVAAALVCGFTEHCVHGCKEPEVYHGPSIHPVWIGDWLRNWNRDDLARVFAVASRHMQAMSRGFPENFQMSWSVAMNDPRAALCALLDLLQIPVPAEINK